MSRSSTRIDPILSELSFKYPMSWPAVGFSVGAALSRPVWWNTPGNRLQPASSRAVAKLRQAIFHRMATLRSLPAQHLEHLVLHRGHVRLGHPRVGHLGQRARLRAPQLQELLAGVAAD